MAASTTAPNNPPVTAQIAASIVITLFGIIFYVLWYLKEYEFEIFGDLNNLKNELELEWKCKLGFVLCNGYNYSSTTSTASNPARNNQLFLFI